MEKDLIIKTLDETLNNVLLAKQSGKETAKINILIQGNELKGFDGLKTGDIITAWAKQNNTINYLPIYCPWFKVGEKDTIEILFDSKQIECMNKPNTVVILKCLDWTDKITRKHYLRLVKERTVNTLKGEETINKILFIVATDSDISRRDYEPLDEDAKKLFKVIKL